MTGMVQKIDALEVGGKLFYTVGASPPEAGGVGPKVKEIGEHQPQGPGDVWMYNVLFDDGSAVRVFNHSRVFFGKPQPAQKLAVPAKPKIIV